MSRDVMKPTERQNVVVVSVRLSKDDAARCQERAAELGVGISTYIRILVRQHLAKEGAYDRPFASEAWTEAAAAGEPEATHRERKRA
jgi:cyclopropane fatty-acyl-phospholipid synthase-like methyltransferase